MVEKNNGFFTPIEDIKDFDSFLSSNSLDYFQTPQNADDGRLGIYSADQQRALLERQTRSLYQKLFSGFGKENHVNVGYDKNSNQIVIVVTDKKAKDLSYKGGRVVSASDNKPMTGKNKPATVKIDVEADRGLTRGKNKENGFHFVLSPTKDSLLLPDLDAVLYQLNKEISSTAKRDIASIRSAFTRVQKQFAATYAGGIEAAKEQLNEELKNAAAIPGTQMRRKMIGGTTVTAGLYADELVKNYLGNIQGRKRGEAQIAILQALKARNKEQARGIIQKFTGQYGRRFHGTEEALISKIDSDRYRFADLVDDALNDMAYARGKIGTSKYARANVETAARAQDLRTMPRSAYHGKNQVLYSSPYSASKAETGFGVSRGAVVDYKRYSAPEDAVMPMLRVFENNFHGETFLDDIVYLGTDGAKALDTIRQTRLTVQATDEAIKKKAARIAFRQSSKEVKSQGFDNFLQAFEFNKDTEDFYNQAVRAKLLRAQQVLERGRKNFDVNGATYAGMKDALAEGMLVYDAIEALATQTGSKVSSGPDKGSAEISNDRMAAIRKRLREKYNDERVFYGASKVSTIDNIRKGPRILEELIGSVIGEYTINIGKYFSESKDNGYKQIQDKLIDLQKNGGLSTYEQRAIDLLLGTRDSVGLIDFSGMTDNSSSLIDAINAAGRNKKDRGGLYNGLASVLDIVLNGQDADRRLFNYDPKTGNITHNSGRYYRAFSKIHQNNEYRAENGGDLSRAMQSLMAGRYDVSQANVARYHAAAQAVVAASGPSAAQKQQLTTEQSYVQQAVDATQNAINGAQIDKNNMISIQTVDANHIKFLNKDGKWEEIAFEDPLYGAFGIENFGDTAAGKIRGLIEQRAKELGVDADSIMVAYDWRNAADRAAGNKVMVGQDERHGGYVSEGYLPGVMFNKDRYESDAMDVFRQTLDPTSRYAYGAARYDLFPNLKDTWFSEGGSAYEALTDSKTEGSFEAKLLGMDPKRFQKYQQIAENGVGKNSAADVMRAYASVHGMIGGTDLWKKLFNPNSISEKRIHQMGVSLKDIGVKFDDSKAGVLDAMKKVFTIGTKENDAFVEYAKNFANKRNININRALTTLFTSKFDLSQMIGARPPYSHGIGDLQHGTFFMDKDDDALQGNDRAMRVSLGSQLSMGADWDGDVAFFLGSGDDKNRRKAFNLRSGSDSQQELREFRAAFKASAMKSGGFSSLKRDAAGMIVNTDLIRDASSRQRAEKVKTGNLANLRSTMQAYINKRAENGEEIDPSLLVAHMFFEGLAQDTISSKKVINKLMKNAGYSGEGYNGGEMTPEQAAAWEEGLNQVNSFIDTIYERGDATPKAVLEGLQQMGLVSEKGLFKTEKLEITGDTIFSLSKMARGKNQAQREKALALLKGLGIQNPVESMSQAGELVGTLQNGVSFDAIQDAMQMATEAMGGQIEGNNPFGWMFSKLLGDLRIELQAPKTHATASSLFYGTQTDGVLSTENSFLELSKVVDNLSYKLSEIIGLLTKSGGVIERIGGTGHDRQDTAKRYGGDMGSQHMAHAIAQAWTASNRNFTVYEDEEKPDSKAAAQLTFGSKEAYDEFQKLTIKASKLDSSEKRKLTGSIKALGTKGKNKELIKKLGLEKASKEDIANQLTILRGSYIGALDAYISDNGLSYDKFDIGSVLNKKGAKSDEQYQLAAIYAHYSSALKQLGVDNPDEVIENAQKMAAKQAELRAKYGGKDLMSEVPLTNAASYGRGTSTADFLIERPDGTIGFYESKTGATAKINDAEKVQAQVYAALGMTMQSEMKNLFETEVNKGGFKNAARNGRSITSWQDRDALIGTDKYETFRKSMLEKWSTHKAFNDRFKTDKEREALFDKLFKTKQGPITSTLGKVGADGTTAVWEANALTPEMAMLLLEVDQMNIPEEKKKQIISGITHLSGSRPPKKGKGEGKGGGGGPQVSSPTLKDRFVGDVMNGPKNAFAMLFRGGVTTRIILKFINQLKKVVQLTEQLDAAMTNLRIITGKTRKEAQGMMKTYNGIAKELGATTAAVSQIGAEWLRQGYNVQETEKLIESSVKLAKLGFMDQGEAVKALTASMKGFNLSAKESMSIVDKLTTLDAKYATTAGDIATALTRVASVANNAGMTLDETAAAITAIIDTTQQDAGTVGNALKTMLSRYGNVKFGSFEALEGDEGEESNINDVERVLNALGIQIRTSKMEMRDFADVLDDIAEKWITLTTVEQNAIAVALGGVRQRNTTVALLNSYGTYKQALEDQENSAGQANSKYGAYQDSIEFHKQNLQVAWEGLVLKLDESQILKDLYDIATFFVSTADKWLPELVSAIPLLLKGLDVLKVGWKRAIRENTVAIQQNTASRNGGKGGGGTDNGVRRDSRGRFVGKNKFAKAIGRKIKGTSMTYGDAIKAGISGAALSGISHGFAGGGVLGNSLDDKWGTTSFETRKDNITTGVASGVGSLVGAAAYAIPFVGPIVGPIASSLGGMIGDGVASIIKYNRHRDEINMRKRVEENKKILDSIQKASGNVTSLGTSIREGMETWSSKDYENNLSYFNSIKAEYLNNAPLRSQIDELLGLTKDGNLLVAKDLTYLTEKVDGISNASKLEAATIIAEADTTYKANEENIKTYNDKLIDEYIQESAFGRFSNDAAAQDALNDYFQSIDAFKRGGAYDSQFSDKELDALNKFLIDNKYVSTYTDEDRTQYTGIAYHQTAESLILAIRNELEKVKVESDINQKKIDEYKNSKNKSYLNASVLLSGLADMDTYQLNNMPLDQAIWLVAQQWDAIGGVDVYNSNGQLYSGARQDIIDYIQSNDRYKGVMASETLTYGDLSSNLAKAQKIIDEKYQGQSLQDILMDLNSKERKNQYTQEEINTFYGANEDGLMNIAHGLNMTAEEARDAGDSISWVTSADIANGIDGMVDKFEKLSNLLSDIASSGSVSASNMKNIIKNYSWLLGSGEDISADNVIQNFVDILSGNKSIDAIAGVIASGVRTDSDLWSLFKKKYGSDWSAIGITDQTNQDKLSGATTWEGVRDVMLGNETAQSTWAQFVAEFTGDLDVAKKLRGILVNAASNVYNNEISNLQSIKESLEDVNKLRQKELDLMKAKLALENAQKEKQRVYREGVGWVYTSDQNAIKEAADKVDELEREKDKEDIQYQIDMLEQAKSILENIEKNEEFEELNKILSSFLDPENGGFNSGIASIVTAIASINPKDVSGKIKDATGKSVKDDTGDVVDEAAEQAKDDLNKLIFNTDGSYKSMDAWSNETFIDPEKKIRVSEALSNRNNPYYENAVKAWNEQVNVRDKAKQNAEGYGIEIPSQFLQDTELTHRRVNGKRNLTVSNSEGRNWTETFLVDDNDEYFSFDDLDESTKDQIYARGNYQTYRGHIAVYHQGKWSTFMKDNKPSGDSDAKIIIGGELYDAIDNDIPNDTWVFNDECDTYGIYKDINGKWHRVTDDEGNLAVLTGARNFHVTSDGKASSRSITDDSYYSTNALGTVSFAGGRTLINERGLEGIITPEGTLTSLPAKSGILPADLTKNLWSLGEVAPNLITELSGKSFSRVSEEKIEDNSMTVGTLNATFNTDSGFDAKTFWSDVKSQIALTKNNH